MAIVSTFMPSVRVYIQYDCHCLNFIFCTVIVTSRVEHLLSWAVSNYFPINLKVTIKVYNNTRVLV